MIKDIGDEDLLYEDDDVFEPPKPPKPTSPQRSPTARRPERSPYTPGSTKILNLIKFYCYEWKLVNRV